MHAFVIGLLVTTLLFAFGKNSPCPEPSQNLTTPKLTNIPQATTPAPHSTLSET